MSSAVYLRSACSQLFALSNCSFVPSSNDSRQIISSAAAAVATVVVTAATGLVTKSSASSPSSAYASMTAAADDAAGVADDLLPNDSLKLFNARYQKLHGYLSIVVCIFGIVSNAMNIAVLSQKSMLSATNFLLTALAITDMLTMTSYLPYATYFYCVATPDTRYPHSHGWVIYLLFNTNFIITCHTIAMWLTVSLAIFRYVVVCRRTVGPGMCTLRRAKITTIAVTVTTIPFCIPNYIMYRPEQQSSGAYWFGESSFVSEFPTLAVFNFWLYGVVLKVVPCVLLTALITLLIRAVRKAEKRRRRLKSQGKREESEKTGEHNRTTAMLVAVVLMFVVTELPQGILAFLSGIEESIFFRVYVPLGDVFDFIVLINSAVNFLLYCGMSRQFRQTFKELFHFGHNSNTKPTRKMTAIHEGQTVNMYATVDTHFH